MRLRDRLTPRRDMPNLTEAERADLRERLARDQVTAERLRLAVAGKGKTS